MWDMQAVPCNRKTSPYRKGKRDEDDETSESESENEDSKEQYDDDWDGEDWDDDWADEDYEEGSGEWQTVEKKSKKEKSEG